MRNSVFTISRQNRVSSSDILPKTDTSKGYLIPNDFFVTKYDWKTAIWVKVSGIWKQCITWTKISGVWKQTIPKIKVGGVWLPSQKNSPYRILIDLGGDAASSPSKTPINNPDGFGYNWNKFVATGLYSGSGLPVNGFYSGLSLSNLINVDNVNTGITMTLVITGNTTFIGAGSSPGLNGNGITTDIQDYNNLATRDSMFTDSSSSPGQLSFTGLDLTRTYSFKFWGSRQTGGAIDNRYIEIKKSTDAWASAINYNSSNNTDYRNCGIISGITGVNNISFDFRSMSGSQFGYIGIIDIIVT